MLQWLSAFRRQYNQADFHKIADADQIYLHLILFDQSINSSQVRDTLADFREKRGRMLSPLGSDSVIFLPEDAIIYYITAFEKKYRASDDFMGPCGGVPKYDYLLLRARFGVNYHKRSIDDKIRPILEVRNI